MTRTILLWALVLAAGAFALQWLEYQWRLRANADPAITDVSADRNG